MSRSLEEERQKTVNILKEDIFTTVGATTGKYLDNNGNQVSNNAWNFTDYIRIEANQQYSISNKGITIGNLPAICFYTKDKAFISGEQLGDVYNKIVKAPSNAEYARLSYASANYKFIKIDSNEIYSTKKKKIGLWINGKPIYRSVIKIDINTNNANISTDILNLNIKELINIYGTSYHNTGSTVYRRSIFVSYSYNSTDVSEFSTVYMNNHYLIFRSRNLQLSYAYVVLEYTKTTD